MDEFYAEQDSLKPDVITEMEQRHKEQEARARLNYARGKTSTRVFGTREPANARDMLKQMAEREGSFWVKRER